MKLPEPYRTIRKKEKIIDNFGGFNNTSNHSVNEFSDMKNISHRSFPSIVPRTPREIVETISKPNGVFSFSGSLYMVDGTVFKKDGVSKGAVSDGRKCLIEFNKYILIFPDKMYYDTVNDIYGSFSNGTIVTDANPDIDVATVHNNRVFGVKGNQIYASKLGDFKEWNVFDQLLTDSWATDVAESGSFKTIGTYQNHVVMQSENHMYELYGYNPSNFQIQETAKMGSIVYSYSELQGVLYFANNNGIYSYAGGMPRKISENIEIKFEKVELASDERYLYANVYDGLEYHLFVFDSKIGLFTKEDNIEVMQFVNHDGKPHALCTNGELIKFNSGDEVFDWSVTLQEFKDDYFNNKIVKRVEIHADMESKSSLSVYFKGDRDREWMHVKTILSESDKKLLLPVNLNRNCYTIKMTGRGYVKINAIKIVALGGGKL